MKPHDTIVVLGGWIVKEYKMWRTTSFEEKNEEESLGDNLRVVAASILYKKNGKTLIIASGGKGKLAHITDAPPVAEVIKDELVELGVKSENIILETYSKNTFEQLLKLSEIIKKKGIISITIVTNKYHLPRVKAMLKYNKILIKLFSGIEIVFADAESILLEHEPVRWSKIIEDAYKSDAMKEKIKKEESGINQIKEGTYNYGN